MRPIKFKGKRIDNGEWVEGYGCVLVDDLAVVIHRQGYNLMNNTATDPETLCQFTGLIDCNGREIWEKDILNYIDNPTGIMSGTYVVTIDAGFIGIDSLHLTDCEPHLWCTVIGNSFDNPELLEDKQ